MAYSKTTWKDNEAPYLNASNLNKIESGIDNNDAQIVENTSDIEQNATDIEQNATHIADNRTDIDINADNILGLSVGEVYQGTWTPEAGTEYPASPEGGWSYYIQFLDDDGYTFTTGDLAGRIANNGDKIIYNGTSWSMIDNTNDMLGYYLVDDIESMLGLSPLQGAMCQVYGYYSANDNGGGTFNYDGSYSGTNNGGTILNGWVRQYTGDIDVKWFGAVGDGVTDDTVAIQDTIDYASTININGIEGSSVSVTGTGNFAVSNTITISGSEGVSLKDISLKAIGATFTSLIPIISIEQPRIEILDCTLDCGKISAGIDVAYGRDLIRGCKIFNFQGYGIKLAGTTGDTWVSDCEITQWFNGDTEFADEVNWTAYGIWIDRADNNIHSCTIRWSGVNIYYGENALSTLISNCHMYNGGSGVLITNKPTIETHSGGLSIVGCYIDNGSVDLYNPATSLVGNTFLCNTSSTSMAYGVGLYANRNGDPYDFMLEGTKAVSQVLVDGTIPILDFFDHNGFSWEGDYTPVSSEIAHRDVRMHKGTVNIYGSNDGGYSAIYATPAPASNGARVGFSDNETTIVPFVRSAGDNIKLKGGQVLLESNDGAIVTLRTNAFVPITAATMDLGGSGNKWKQGWFDQAVSMKPLSVAPTTADGVLAISDGTGGGFDATSGEGLYRWTGTVWKYIG